MRVARSWGGGALCGTGKKGNVLDLYKISSAEGRSHIKSLFTKDDGTNVPIRYVDKKRIQSWLYANRLQLPLRNLDLDSNIIIPQKSEKSSGSVKNSLEDSSVSHSLSSEDAFPVRTDGYGIASEDVRFEGNAFDGFQTEADEEIATAGSKEARELERIKKAFEDAYREGGVNKNTTAGDDGVKYSIKKTSQMTY